jgi:hypothetical protein
MSVEQTHRIQLDGNGDVMDDTEVSNIRAGKNADGSAVNTGVKIVDVDAENAHSQQVQNFGDAAGFESMSDAEVVSKTELASEKLALIAHHVEIMEHQRAAGLPTSAATQRTVVGLTHDIGIITDNMPREVRDTLDAQLLSQGISIQRVN